MTASRPAVWAPFASGVELVLGADRRPMRRCDGNWWQADEALPAGTDYAFALDGGEPLPDPRSPWQPSGVHGPSRTVDHAAFAWTDAGWRPPPLRQSVIFELHVGTFSTEGTFDGVIGHLDHLVELGVTHLELMPVAEFAGARGWGYDGVDLYAPHSAYGGPDGLKRLVDAAHARGLAVLLDVVYNHLGPEGNYLGRFGPYFTDRYGTPWGAAVNFDDRGSHEVRRFVVDNALMWLRDYHIDGLRLDAVQAIYDMSAVHILEELTSAVRHLEVEVGRPFAVTAESDLNDPRIVRAPDRGGFGLDAAWSDDVHHALQAALTGERGGYYLDFGDPAILPRALRDPFVYADAYSAHRDRRHGRPVGDLPGDRFVACLQNHDQVGNRARGDRIGHLVSEGRARIGAALLLMSPYVPLLFAGEEWNASTPFPFFASHTDPDLARAVSEGRRREFSAFGWDPLQIPDPMDEATFASARLDWAERDREPHAGMLAWYRALIGLRRSTPELTDADRSAVDVAGSADGRLCLRRGPITVVTNLGADPVPAAASGRVVLAWPVDATPDAPLPPDGILVLDAR
jgi:maltooligosyltrehalose trehalohydrolase